MATQLSNTYDNIDVIVQEVHETMHEQWVTSQLDEFYTAPIRTGSLNEYQSNMGRWIRNTHGLWAVKWEREMQDLGGYMADASPNHPDAVSSRIITEVWKLGMQCRNKNE